MSFVSNDARCSPGVHVDAVVYIATCCTSLVQLLETTTPENAKVDESSSFFSTISFTRKT